MNWLARLFRFGPSSDEPAAPDQSPQSVAIAQPPQTREQTAAAHIKIGNALLDEGRFEDALQRYRQAILVDCMHVGAHVNLGFTLVQLGQMTEALAALRQALALDPKSHDAHYLIGTVLLSQHAFTTAIVHLEQAIALKPDLLVAHRDLGKVLHDIGQHERAKTVLHAGVAIDPQFADLHYFLGNIALQQMELDDALTSYDRALAIQPDYAAVHNNRAQVLLDLCEFGSAAAAARKALALDPSMHAARSNLVMTLSVDGHCSPEDYLVEARLYGELLMAQKGSVTSSRAAVNHVQTSTAARHLRVGFVSGDLRNHPVGFFLDNVMAFWDRSLGLEAIAYSNHPSCDELTARLKTRFSAWRDLSIMPDEAAARQIESDGIDVLVDLSGHTPENRLPLFARRPAPVQVTWLGYWASTGLPTMDWLLADPTSIPPDRRAHFTESIWYLPDTRLCFTPPAGAGVPPVSVLPARDAGYVTFGSFQRLTKLNDDVLALWARVMQALPESRLRLQSRQMQDRTARAHLLQRLQVAGIDAQRVQLVEASARLEYLAAHAEVDILLDTFPHTGATTTCEALWMGVPTLTLAGTTMLARQGASLLGCAGLADWIARDKDAYVAFAVRHASDLDTLGRLRASLREQVAQSPVFDAARFTANLQTALREISREHTRRLSQ